MDSSKQGMQEKACENKVSLSECAPGGTSAFIRRCKAQDCAYMAAGRPIVAAACVACQQMHRSGGTTTPVVWHRAQHCKMGSPIGERLSACYGACFTTNKVGQKDSSHQECIGGGPGLFLVQRSMTAETVDALCCAGVGLAGGAPADSIAVAC